jgi:phosphatidate phosphatase APP1
VDPFAPVPGMATVYQSWATNSGAVFLYVSASPWQLFPPLQEFTRSSGFPDGVFYLKQFRLKDRTFQSLWEDPQVYKKRVIEPLLEKFNAHQFVLVGDSGEKDPEIYAALQQKYPERIARILIRDTTGQGRDDERYRQLFENTPAEIWQIFSDPNELSRNLSRARLTK